MENSGFQKLIQKKIYDLLSHKYGLLVVIVGAILLGLSAFHFGESVVEWSTEKYASVFNSFSDNIAGRSYRERLCLPVPIDVVYTWVNGTDAQLIRNLQRVKLDMQDQLNSTRKVSCVFRNCLPSNMVVLAPLLQVNMTLKQLADVYTEFRNARRMYSVMSPIDYQNYTVMVYPDKQDVSELVNKTLMIKGTNTTFLQGYITSDATVLNGVPIYDQIIMSGFPHTLTEEELKHKLPEKHQARIDKLELNTDKGIAVLYVDSPESFEHILGETNFTIDGKEPTLTPARLVWDLRDLSRDEDISASRFEDNEELRYSLRSIERFAPWVRHIYIITNGQLPYWLNLESTRITVVTHEEIFTNKSHLPTFGSPAIESNVHKIPGLSDKFIYMNDDVMFGKEVWPDDFYTYSSGQKIYLTWPVPNCNEGCPSSWIRDGYCDKACNVSECEWDAGDCDGSNTNQNNMGWAAAGWSGENKGYCHSGCANNWIADRYCDTACNVLDCGYDAGDCGTDKYTDLHGILLTPNITKYTLPPGLPHGYFNLSHILSGTDIKVKTASYDDNAIIRTIAVARKFSVLTVVLYENMNRTKLDFTLEYGTENVTKQLNFSLAVDTQPQKEKPVVGGNNNSLADGGKNGTAGDVKTPAPPTEEPIVFVEIPMDQMKPVIVLPTKDSSANMPEIVASLKSANFSALDWPEHFKLQYDQLQQEFKQEELTQQGLDAKLELLFLEHHEYSKENPQKIGVEDDTAAGKQSLPAKKESLQQIQDLPKEDLLNEGRKKGLQQIQDLPKEDLLNEGRKKGLQQIQDLPKEDLLNEGRKEGLQTKPIAKAHDIHNVEQAGGNRDNRESFHTDPSVGREPLQPGLKVAGNREPNLNMNREQNLNRRKPIKSRLDGYPGVNDKMPNVAEDNPNIDQDGNGGIDNSEAAQADEQVHFQGVNENGNRLEGRGGRRPGRHLLSLYNASESQGVRETENWFDEKLVFEDSRFRQLKDDQFNAKYEGVGDDMFAVVNTDDDDDGGDKTDGRFLDKTFVDTVDIQPDTVKLLPWERQGSLGELQQEIEKKERQSSHQVVNFHQRRLLDTFGDSLRHVNSLYNKAFGYTARKVPGHMPHMIDKNIMMELQNRFPKEWEETSAHKVRHSKDMQYAFAYFYYLMGVKQNISAAQVFDEMDTDNSKILSDREIRTLATRLYDLPLDLQTLTNLEMIFINCSRHLPRIGQEQPDAIAFETYYEKDMPQVTRNLFANCKETNELIIKKFPPQNKYKYVEVDDSQIAFKMIKSNISSVVGQLDDIRKHPKKFICLNDNIDHNLEQAKTVKAILADFYESVFPVTSQFELPREYRNRFTHIDELREWRRYRDWLKFWTHIALALLVIFTVASYFSDKIEAAQRAFSRHRTPKTGTSSDQTPGASTSDKSKPPFISTETV